MLTSQIDKLAWMLRNQINANDNPDADFHHASEPPTPTEILGMSERARYIAFCRKRDAYLDDAGCMR